MKLKVDSFTWLRVILLDVETSYLQNILSQAMLSRIVLMNKTTLYMYKHSEHTISISSRSLFFLKATPPSRNHGYNRWGGADPVDPAPDCCCVSWPNQHPAQWNTTTLLCRPVLATANIALYGQEGLQRVWPDLLICQAAGQAPAVPWPQPTLPLLHLWETIPEPRPPQCSPECAPQSATL